MNKLSPKDAWNWLNRSPQLHELMEAYPSEWELAGRELIATLENGSAQKLNDLAARAKAEETLWQSRVRQSRNNLKVIETALPGLVKSRMSLLALEKCYLASATGKSSGKVRFNLINGFIIQRLLFLHHLTRKPASLTWVRLLWPFITQKRFLMPLAQQKGIYCFYSLRLIEELAVLIGNRKTLEIGAGDGTLSRFLIEAGARVTATDDYSWRHAVQYPEAVEKLDARQALDKYQPEAVLCSWPPPANNFERHVFSTRSVGLYIIIGSRYKFASGNWDAYAAQRKFEWKTDERLSRYVLPPELDNAVLIFRRTHS